MKNAVIQKHGKNKKAVVAVIGVGAYGKAIVTQSAYIPEIYLAVAADLTPDKAKAALTEAGIADSELIYCSTAEEAENIIQAGKYVYTDNADMVAHIPSIEMVCESTGNPEICARHASEAIENGKHVAMVTKDCDAAIGPVLKKKADEKGVVYTPVDGDQHGLLVQMYDWAKTIGLSVICGGKATDGEFVFDRVAKTVTIQTDKKVTDPYQKSVGISDDDLKFFDMIPEGKAAEYIQKRAEALSLLPPPGSYDLCEMTIAANYTEMKPQTETMIHAPLRITEIPIVYARKENGGVIDSKETIDLVTCMRAPDEAGLGGGVFLVVECDNAYSNHILATKGQIANNDTTATVIYRPYHLCGVETPFTILSACLLGISTGSDNYRPEFDLTRVAARDIRAGEVFGNDHSSMMTSRITKAAALKPGNLIEGHLLTGNKAAVDIPKGTPITVDMVEEPEESILWKLRREQDHLFLENGR